MLLEKVVWLPGVHLDPQIQVRKDTCSKFAKSCSDPLEQWFEALLGSLDTLKVGSQLLSQTNQKMVTQNEVQSELATQ